MPPTDHDIVICCHGPDGAEIARAMGDGLGQRGFRVLACEQAGAGNPPVDRMAAIDQAPDFLLVLTPGAFEAGVEGPVRVRDEVAHAMRLDRNIVVLTAPDGSLPADLEALRQAPTFAYRPDRLAETVALVAHRMTSDESVEDRGLLRLTKRLFAVAGAVVLMVAILQTVPVVVKWWKRPRPLPPVAPLTLYWAGFTERVTGGLSTVTPLADGMVIRTGDRVQIAFTPSGDGHAYVVGRDTRGTLVVLFPSNTIKNASRVRAGPIYRAPVAGGWWNVEADAGLEAVYVFASYDPLQNLEELIEEPEALANPHERRELLELTLNGLLDGRHATLPRRLTTRTGQLVDRTVEVAPGPSRSTATLDGGRTVELPMLAQPGMISTVVEIRLQPEARAERR